ncbi:MAG: proton-conducting transporter membrane subunit [Vicinamibacterales bacterium]|jgi:multicomponent Na+:H+ antiporter subunit D|nr:cation:proton antiporter [Acidobacteriota bacterium]MDP7470870.1 proton-conducting transporter membrane subunit [Vicinamibacterales bacterium]MDP7670962.1 proton-conducting transporter membrane subunit [Vicinamibacterales bacterium]HJO39706.1 proton-conducting transporter membrane subunit [Vicinamibacterales bacterium]|tara:strand:+ start:300 stop:1793 length:1494 start_codon:yes stop_codon:yes gene_type:complete
MDLAARPLAAVLVSLLAAALLPLAGRRPAVREAITFAAAGLKLALVASMLPAVLDGQAIESARLPLAAGLTLGFRADALGLLFALTASSLWLLTSLYSVGYLRAAAPSRQTAYYVSFAVCLSATVGIAFAANLLTFFVCYEVLTLATYPLVVHAQTEEARSAGRRYLVYTLGAGQVLFVAIVWTETVAPGVDFTPGGFLAGRAEAGVLATAFALFIVGCGVKAAIMPLHGWLPAAMVAPTPVSALLHAVAVVKAGAFGVVRIVGYVFGVDVLRATGADTVLVVAAAATILIASMRALGEDHLKRLLAYSTIGQLSYIVLGAALGSVAALTGAMFHIAGHGFMKITMFFCAGALHTQAHRDGVHGLDGLGRQMPVTMTAFAVGACGLAGVPLLAGFIAKWNLGVGALTAGDEIIVGVLVVSGLLNVAYFFPIIYDAFFKAPTPETAGAREAPWPMALPLGVTAAVALVLGVAPSLGFRFFALARLAAESVVAGSGGLP